MKFILFTLEYPPFKGGIAHYYSNMVKNWPQGSDVFILDNSDDRLLRKSGPLKWLKSIKVLKETVEREKINHVLVGHILPLGISTFILSKIINLKYSIFLHGLDFSLATKNKWKRFLTGIIVKGSNKIICANSKTLEDLKSIYGDSDKYTLVNPGVDSNPVAFNLNLNKERLKDRYELDGKRVVFSIGRLVKRKGFDNTIKAINSLEDNDVVYIISGTGPDEEYLKEIAKESSKNIIFTGEISEEDKWTFFDLSDIFIMPARNISGDFEGFGIVYLEANLVKRAVIAGRSGGISDVVVDGLNGLLVDPEDVSDIASKIKKLLDDENLRLELASSGRERVLKMFTWDKKSQEIYNFLVK